MITDFVERFYGAWNERDADAIAATFTPNGTFADPFSRGELSGGTLHAHIASLVAALPELHFTVRRTLQDVDSASVSWSLRGVCTGNLDRELAAQGAPFALEGFDWFELSDGGIRSVRRLFERRDLSDSLGMQTIVEPVAVGSMTFGYSLRDWISKEKPGALGMTWILARDEAEKSAIRVRAREIVRHFHDVPGFIGIVTGFAGLHGFTFTAWESEEALRNGTHTGAHSEAMQAFHNGLSAGVFTSVWMPARLNRLWTRCPNGHPNDGTRADGKCEQCRAPLPAREPYL